MTLGLTEYDAVLKELYDNQKLEKVTFQNRPLLASIPKFEKFAGRLMPFPFRFGDVPAASATFATAQTAGGNQSGKYEKWDLTRVNYFGFCQLTNEVMEATESGLGAFAEATEEEIDSIINYVSNRLEHQLFRSGWGDVGQVATDGVSGSTITLANTSDVNGIEVGQEHVISSSLNAATLRGSGASLTVSGVNRSTGVITYTAGVTATISGTTAGDYIFIKGDRQNSATPSMICLAGLQAWAPYGATSSTAFFGVDRTVDSRLQGAYLDGTGYDVEDAILEAGNRVAALGHTPTHAFCSFGQWTELVKDVKENQRFVDKLSANVGFNTIVIHGYNGPIKVLPSIMCPSNRLFVLDINKLSLNTLGKAVDIVNTDGLRVLRAATADAVECRIAFRGNLLVKVPSAVCTVNVNAVGV